MGKCIHGYGTCSECHNPSNEKTAAQVNWDMVNRFNEDCAKIMNFRPNYRHGVHFWITENNYEFQKAHWNPKTKLSDLAVVVDAILDDKDFDSGDLKQEIIDTTVEDAFINLTLRYIKEKIDVR